MKERYASMRRQLKKTAYAPNIAFTSFNIQKRGGISVRNSLVNDTLTLEPDERNITVSFAALDFTKPAYLEYAYRIKNLSDEWTYIGKNRSVSLVNLSAGDFDLEVKSNNSDGVWSDNIKVLHIHVTYFLGNRLERIWVLATLSCIH